MLPTLRNTSTSYADRSMQYPKHVGYEQLTSGADSLGAQRSTGHHDTPPPERYTAQFNKKAKGKQVNLNNQKPSNLKQRKKQWRRTKDW